MLTYKTPAWVCLGATALLLSACGTHAVKYNNQDFINPDRTENINAAPPQKISATFSFGDNPAVVKAYQQFTRSGSAADVHSKYVRTIAYDPYMHPIVSCALLRLCVIQLEQGEIINDIELGDTKDWLLARALIGTPQQGSYQVVVKPQAYDLATDIVITTNKRIYDLGLVSVRGTTSHIVNFYYPQETAERIGQELLTASSTAANNPVIDLTHLNFNYSLQGDSPAWRPIRVFDDGTKTFVEMPAISERMDLPVLYLNIHKETQIANYRYRRPYYVVDSLFKEGVLISGKGAQQIRVVIHNHNFT